MRLEIKTPRPDMSMLIVITTLPAGVVNNGSMNSPLMPEINMTIATGDSDRSLCLFLAASPVSDLLFDLCVR